MEQKNPSARQVIIAAEKGEKRNRIQRALELMFKRSGENNQEIDWHLASTPEEAIELINLALSNVKGIKNSLEIVVAMSGFQGQWFEIAGYLKLIELTTKAASKQKEIFKAVLMSGHPEDVQNAEAEGLRAINTLLNEEEIARYAAQILLGEPADHSQFEDTTEGQEYQTEADFSQEPDKKPWDYLTSA